MTDYSYDDYIIDIIQSSNLADIRFRLDDDPYNDLVLFTDNNATVTLNYDVNTEYYIPNPQESHTEQTKFSQATTFSIYSVSDGYLVEDELISLIRPPVSELIAKATSSVINGRSTTVNIVFEQGKSFQPGQVYTIYADYSENSNYEYGHGVGELEIQKTTTTTTLTGTPNITIGDSVTLTIAVTDSSQNSVTRGTLNIYDGNTLIQSNVTVTGQTTSVSITPNTVGAHNIYVIYSDTQNEYNDSTSNTFTLTVNKITSTLTAPNGLTLYFDETTVISGTLNNPNGALSNQPVLLYDGNTLLQTVNTVSNGTYSFTYTPNGWGIDGNNLTIKYNGTATQESANVNVPINLMKRDVTLNSLTVTPNIAGQTATIECQLQTSNNVLINEGKVAFKANGSTLKDSNNQTIQANVSNGRAVAEYNVPSNWAGQTKTFTITYNGTTNYNKITNGGNVNITFKHPTTITTNNTVSMVFGDTETITGTLSSNGTPLTNQPIYLINFGGGTLANATTDSNGEFSFTYTPDNQNVNNQNIFIQYEGTTIYASATVPILVQLEILMPIMAQDFYDSNLWDTSPLTFYDEDYPENSLVVFEYNEDDENAIPNGFYSGATLNEMKNYSLDFTITSTSLGDYFLGFWDVMSNSMHGILASVLDDGYIKLDSIPDVVTNINGQIQPLAQENTEISLHMEIIEDDINNGMVIQTSINNGALYNLFLDGNEVDFDQTFLFFEANEGLMVHFNSITEISMV